MSTGDKSTGLYGYRSLSTAAGTSLDLIAGDRFSLQRLPGETDARFRTRLQYCLRGTWVMLGPLRLYSPADVQRVYDLLVESDRRPGAIRGALERIIRGAQSQSWAVGATEQVIFEVANAFREEGILHDGVLHHLSEQRTKARVDKDALDAWYVASTLILDDGD